MATPTHLAHKPIASVDDYELYDGIYARYTDVKSLSIGKAQYDGGEISVKVWRHTGTKWSRQSEELPLHRIIDLNTTILKSMLISAGIPEPTTQLNIKVIAPADLNLIMEYYKNNREHLLPKLRELKVILDYFMQEEPKL